MAAPSPSPVYIDDRNPLIIYSNASWHQDKGGSIKEYNLTSTWCNIGGAKATFTFRGTSVAVYGTIVNADQVQQVGGVPPQSSYSVDGGAATVYNASVTGTIQYKQQFFQSAILSTNRQHTLVVTTLTDFGYFYLDYFTVTPVEGVSVGGVSASPRPGTSSSSSVRSTTTPTPSTSTTKTAAGSPSTVNTAWKKWGIAVIILGVLTCILVVCMIIRRRRRTKALRKNAFGDKEIETLWSGPKSIPFSENTVNSMHAAPSQPGPSYNTGPNAVSPFPMYPSSQPVNIFIPSPSPQVDGTPNGVKGAVMHGGLQYVPLPSSQAGLASGYTRTGAAVPQQGSTDTAQQSVGPTDLLPPPQYRMDA